MWRVFKNILSKGRNSAFCAIIFCSCPYEASALDQSPWLGNFLEFNSEISYEVRKSTHISTGHRTIRHSLHDRLLRLGVSFMPKPQWEGSCEMIGIKSKDRGSRWGSVVLGLRKQWLDDVAGDKVSLTGGLACLARGDQVKNRIGLLQHGNVELMAHVSLGKEFHVIEDSYSRIWVLAGLGVANRSDPFYRLQAHLSRSVHDTHFIEAFALHRQGTGGKKLKITDFSGYGRLKYQSTEIGLKYTYRLEWIGSLYAQLTRGVHAKNAPKSVQSWQIGFEYPFGL